MLLCPKCGFDADAMLTCPRCGVVFAKLREPNARPPSTSRERGPAATGRAPAGATYDRGSADVAATRVLSVPVEGERATRPVRLSLGKRAAFARAFAALLRAGVSVNEALLTLMAHEPSRRLQGALAGTRERLLAGDSYREALQRSGLEGAAGKTGMALLHAAEVSGHLSDAWDHIAETCERDLGLRREALRALFYPALLLVLGCFLLPLRVLLLEGPGAYLWAAVSPLLWGGGLLIAAVLAWRRLGPRFPRLVMFFEQTPLLCTPSRRLAHARAAYTLSSLLDAGLPIAPSLQHAAQTADHETLRRTLRHAAADVEAGATLADAFTHAGANHALRIVVATGEKGGTLPASLRAYAHSEKISGEHALRLTVRAVTVLFMVGAFAYLGWRSFAQVMEVRQSIDRLFDSAGGRENLLPKGIVPGLEDSMKELEKVFE